MIKFLEYSVDEEEGWLHGYPERNICMMASYNKESWFGLRKGKKELIRDCAEYFEPEDEICLLRIEE